MRRLAVLVALALVLLSPAAARGCELLDLWCEEARPEEPEPEPESATPEDELLWLLNESRAEHGLPGVQRRADLDDVAERHSEDMNREGQLRHNDAYFSAESRERHGARTLGENVAYGPTMAEVHRALMESDEHRAIILDPRWTFTGIGVVQGSDRWWVTEDFLEPRDR